MTRRSAKQHPHLRQALTTTLVVAVACLVAVWLAPRASGAAAEWVRTPAVRLHTLTTPADGRLPLAAPAARGAAPVSLDAGMRFSMVGVIADVPGAVGVTVRVRASLDGSAWGPWMETPLEVAEEGGVARAFTDPLWTGAARYAQVAAVADAEGGFTELTGVRIVAIDPTEDAGVVARAVGALRRTAAAIAGVGLVPPASAAATAPPIVTRAQWGADESLRSGSPAYAPVKMAFVHHTAGGNDYTAADAPALMRGVLAYHTRSLGWSDIGYNFLVDRFGTIYEGRHGGMDRGVIGAQVYGFNTGSTGISVMGTFTEVAPPTQVVTALERLLAWKLSTHGLDPRGTAKLTCGATQKFKGGDAVPFPVVAGHRDANYTECPGSRLYSLLPAIRANVARRVGATVAASLSADTQLISPNGDGVHDKVRLDVKITAAADWRITLRASGGGALRSWSGQGASATVTWGGSADGKLVADGVYALELTATSAAGATDGATRAITVDTTAPRLTRATAAPLTFSPNGDARAETAAVTYSPAEACAVRVGILDAGGDVRRWLHGWRARGTGSYTVTWDGRIIAGDGLAGAPDGRYRFRIERRDAAGNIARLAVAITVDRTLGFPTAVPATLSPNGDGTRDQTTLGFRLTRRAAVTIAVRLDEKLVRTLDLGTLAAGAHAATWNGKAGSGEYLVSGRPTFTVSATSTLGRSSASKGLIVDLYPPKVYATPSKTTSLGTTTRLGFKVWDPYSAEADVGFVVTDAKGRVVASGRPGWRPTDRPLTISWTPKARGVFTVTYRATDRGGNREASPARTIVTVR